MFEAPGFPEPWRGDVDALAAGDQLGARERADQVRDRYQQRTIDAVTHRAPFSAIPAPPHSPEAVSGTECPGAAIGLAVDKPSAKPAIRTGQRFQTMPTYVYECSKCGDEVEAWQSFTDDPLKRHSGCGGQAHQGVAAGRDRPEGPRLLPHRQPQREQALLVIRRIERRQGHQVGEVGSKSDEVRLEGATDAKKDTKSSDTKKSAASATSK